MRIKNAICRALARAIQDEVDAWKLDHDDAMQAWDIQDLVAECIALRKYVGTWKDEAWQLLMANKLKHVQATGEVLKRQLSHVEYLINLVENCVKSAAARGWEFDKAQELRDAKTAVAAMGADFEKRWPFVDAEQVKRSREDFDRGRYQPAEEILGELQGPDRAGG